MRGIQDLTYIVFAAALTLGCDGTSPLEPPPIAPKPVTEPLLRLVVAPLLATIRAGETLSLTARAATDDRAVVREIAVRWQSSDDAIASVNADGTVSGLRPGRATITVLWGASRAVAQITVLKGDPPGIACLSLSPKLGECK